MKPEMLVLVDENDHFRGIAEKMEVHKLGLLHRAFSIMIFNPQGELLIQKRAKEKYHSAGLWANSCCGHPRCIESPMQGAERRLQEELGFASTLEKITEVSYCLTLANGLYEHEYTHVFSAIYTGSIQPNPDEVEAVRWVMPSDLQQQTASNPTHYAPWFCLYLTKYYDAMFNRKPTGK